MSQQLTQNVAAPIVVLLSKDGAPVEALAFGDVTCKFLKAGAVSFTAKVLTALNFTEVGDGVYTISFTGAELDTLGSFTVVVQGADIDQSTTMAQVVAATVVTTPISIQTCVVTGHVVGPTGEPVQDVAVSAYMLGKPSIEQHVAAVTEDMVSAKTDANGQFFITLIRLADVEVVIPAVNYRRRLVVPNQASVNLFTGVP